MGPPGVKIRTCESKSVLRDTIRQLKRKISELKQADALKASDLRSQHQLYEQELLSVKKLGRLEVLKLMNQLKRKEQQISQLRKQNLVQQSCQHLKLTVSMPCSSTSSGSTNSTACGVLLKQQNSKAADINSGRCESKPSEQYGEEEQLQNNDFFVQLIDESFFENGTLSKSINGAKINEATAKINNEERLSQRICELEKLKLHLEEQLEKMNDLKEQNELLEFRILELEGVQDKWSLESQNTHPDVRDVWTDTESDSGITSSPGSPPTVKHTDFVKQKDGELTKVERSSSSSSTSSSSSSSSSSSGPSENTDEKPFLELSAEIKKLNEFKSKIEEKKSKTAVNESCDLQLYKGRNESLEKRILALENNEIKLKQKIEDYLNRETILENRYKDLSGRYEKLQSKNLKLEEEKCELEEIENDTRLDYQRLQHDFIYLDNLSKKLSRQKTNLEKVIGESNQRIKELEDQLERSEQHNYELEERECELHQKIDNLTNANRNSWDSGINGGDTCDQNIVEENQSKSIITELQAKIEALEKRESSYIETLQLGDEIWMQMEQSYKKKLQESHEKQSKLEQELLQLMEKKSVINGSKAVEGSENGPVVVPLDEHLLQLQNLVSSMRAEIEQLETERSVLKKTNFQLNNQIDAMIIEQNRAFEVLHKQYANSSKIGREELDDNNKAEGHFENKNHSVTKELMSKKFAKFQIAHSVIVGQSTAITNCHQV